MSPEDRMVLRLDESQASSEAYKLGWPGRKFERLPKSPLRKRPLTYALTTGISLHYVRIQS